MESAQQVEAVARPRNQPAEQAVEAEESVEKIIQDLMAE